MAAEAVGPPKQVYSKAVRAGGAVAAAGVQDGDRIVAINGTAVEDVGTFWRIIWGTRPGDRVELELDRGGSRISAAVTLAAPKA